jgi:type 1 glutamine amidotransferase
MDYVRLRLLQLLQEQPHHLSTVANDFTDITRWLQDCQLLLTYVAGPYLDDAQSQYVQQWLAEGGHWLALHGTSGGRAVRLGEERRQRKMVKTSHHATLGSFFLNHPPLRQFRVNVANRRHVLTTDLPESFEVVDELYLIELQDPNDCQVLLTTQLAADPSPPGFGFVYDQDTSLLPDGKTRVLGYTREVGKGGVAYIALGHCHSPTTNRQPVVDPGLHIAGAPLQLFRGAWETEPFEKLLRNGIAWGLNR